MRARTIWILLTLSACSDGSPPSTAARAAPTVSRAEEPTAIDPATLVGRFESESLCLVLLANGDAELILNRRPKLVVLGRATREGETIRLEVERIWSARFLSRCRERHETGHWDERTQVLGIDLRAGTSVSMRLEAESNDRVRLCAEQTCETLTRAAVRLPSMWRTTQAPDDFEIGSLVQLNVQGRGHLAYAQAAGSIGRAYGNATVEPTAGGFAVTFRPERIDEPPPVVLGRPLTADVDRRCVVRRLAGQRLEVRGEDCSENSCATVLERYFDSHAYDLE